MEVLRDVEACRPGGGSVVSIGAYDGVHLGHQAVIASVRERAAALGVQSAVVTFDRHPASVVRPASAPRLLTDLEQKLELLSATGLDRCLVISFDEARSHEPAEEFVREVLVNALGAKAVIVGEDFHFGHQRRGNVALLTEMGAEHGFDVVGLELVDGTGAPAAEGERASSTAIRHALVEGDLGRATSMLGRAYEVRGVVAHGDKRGRELGFPTANVSVPGDILLPADGIYAGAATRPDGESFPAAISIGTKPTFGTHPRVCEAHLIGFDGPLNEYDWPIRLRFHRWLRDQLTYPRVEPLIEQLQRDIAAVKAMADSVLCCAHE